MFNHRTTFCQERVAHKLGCIGLSTIECRRKLCFVSLQRLHPTAILKVEWLLDNGLRLKPLQARMQHNATKLALLRNSKVLWKGSGEDSKH